MNSADDYSKEWTLDRESLQNHQLGKLNQLLKVVAASSGMYREKLQGQTTELSSIDSLRDFPLTTKQELVDAASAGKWLTRPPEEYVRFHQTSGTRGEPTPVPDTAEDWEWWIHAWRHTLSAAQVTAGDRAFLAFSFGPFVGFWSAFDALVKSGVQAIPGGGMTSSARLDLIQRTEANVLFCTPSYALHLAAQGARSGIRVNKLSVEKVVVAGEPGGSLPATRKRISNAWGARVIDHAGATEVGPWGFGDDLWSNPPGLRVIESEFIAEFLSVETGEPAKTRELSHLVLTNLGRYGAPIIRYQTGDLVRPEWPSDGPCRFVRLAGGVVGRADDMLVVRGVNVFPSSIEEIMRSQPTVEEWRITVEKRNEMDDLLIEVEDRSNDLGPIADALRLCLGLRVDVRAVAPGTLPRSDYKARRLIDRR